MSAISPSIPQNALPIINNRLTVKARPHAKKTAVTKIEDSIVYVDLYASPQKNQANLELLKLLFRITKRPCRIQTGARSKHKVIIFE